MDQTIFHKFASGEIRPDKVLYEDDELLAFDNIKPVSPVHVLIIPKKEIVSIADMTEGDQEIVGKMLYRAKLLAEELGIDHPGYKVAFNVREGGGQTIAYLHLHLMGGPKPWNGGGAN
jgi:histidine triad (HIT) family protein